MTDKKKISEKDIKELKAKCDELENSYKRAVADYQNLLKRTADEREKYIKMANEALVSDLLEIIDDLQNSQSHIADEGLNKIIEKFTKILTASGVNEIESLNKDFNPEEHEAIESVDGDENKVIKVHRKGYKLFERTIRPAIVAVGNGNKIS